MEHRQRALELVRLHRPAGMTTVIEILPIYGKYTLIWLFYLPFVVSFVLFTVYYHLCLDAVEGIEAPFPARTTAIFTVFSPAYLRSGGPLPLHYRFNFDVGLGVEPMSLMWSQAPPKLCIPPTPSIQTGENTTSTYYRDPVK